MEGLLSTGPTPSSLKLGKPFKKNKTRGQNHDLVDLYVYLCLSLFIFLSLLDLFGPMLTNLDQFRPI